MQILNENELSKIIIGCAIEVHKQLDHGLLESAYLECLYYELCKAGLDVQKEKPMPITNKKVVIEIKTVETLTDVHTAQVLTYLKLGNYYSIFTSQRSRME
jgi:hypothetical protein